jgi:hypothetical protein
VIRDGVGRLHTGFEGVWIADLGFYLPAPQRGIVQAPGEICTDIVTPFEQPHRESVNLLVWRWIHISKLRMK